MNLDESYRALGLKPGASMQEVRRAYREMVKFFHPDRHQASPGLLRKATEETKKLNLAYERICKVFGTGRRAASDRARPQKTPRPKPTGAAPIPAQPYIFPACGIKLNGVAPARFTTGSPSSEAGR